MTSPSCVRHESRTCGSALWRWPTRRSISRTIGSGPASAARRRSAWPDERGLTMGIADTEGDSANRTASAPSGSLRGDIR
jgi:hypothetical protein